MRSFVAWAFIVLGLAGCQDASPPAADVTALAAPTPYVKREGVSVTAATIALVTLSGAPEAISGDFREALGKALAARGVVADGAKPRYLLRIYLSARPEEGGASVDYVVDAFDPHRQRVARLEASFSAKGAGDAWSLVSAENVNSLAANCADDIAAFLSNMPEAVAVQAEAAAN